MSLLHNCRSRKNGLRNLFLASMLTLLSGAGGAETLRQSTAEFARDPAKVAALERGIAAMKKNSEADPLSKEFRTSFAYWANIHGYFGSGLHATNKETKQKRLRACKQSNPPDQCNLAFAQLRNWTPPEDGITNDIWGTCTHTPQKTSVIAPPPPLNLNFLPWHRIYLYFFERTVAKHSGLSDFALPYWDYYTEPSQFANEVSIPAMVRVEESPLWNKFRSDVLNKDTDGIAADETNSKNAFATGTTLPKFTSKLESTVHGKIHCVVSMVCPGPTMGLIAAAGNDPLFYLHHANIDRLWQCWLNQKANGQTIDLAWAKANLGMPDEWYQTSFTFVDENGDKVSMSIADVFTPGKIPVRYTMEKNCPASKSVAAPQPVLQAAALKPRESPFKQHGPIQLAQQVALSDQAQLIGTTGGAQNRILLNSVQQEHSVKSGGDTHLYLNNVRFKGSPIQTYRILLSHAKTHKTAYIATFSYFGVGDGAHAAHDANHDPQLLGDFEYQINDQLRELGINSLQDVRIRFEPTDMLARRNGNNLKLSKDGITIDSIRLETTAAGGN